MTIEPKWQVYGGFAGWQWEGTVPPSVLVGQSWEVKAVRVVAAAEGGKVDMVQCYDAGIMTAGPLGATVRFGTLQALLGAIPLHVLQRHLGGVFEEAGVGLQLAPGMSAVFTRGLRPLTDLAELRDVFFAGSDGKAWNGEQVDFAERWVRGLAALLQDPASHPAVTAASVNTMMGYLHPARGALGWTQAHQVPPTPELRKAAACWVAFAINNPTGAQRLLQAAGARGLLSAESLLSEAQAPGYPTTFAQRVGRTRRALDAETW